MPDEVLAVEVELYSRHVQKTPFDLNGAGKVACGFAADLMGWSMRNLSSSTLATIDIYDGPDTSGTPIMCVNLAASTSSNPWFGDAGIRFDNAIYINVTAQEVKGSLFFRRRPAN